MPTKAPLCAASQAPVDPDAERARLKKLASYFGSLGILPQHSSNPQRDPPPRTPSPARDATLTALAQLGPLRLQCDRSFVSLIDRNQQYIIAEATPSLPYYDSSDARLYLGVGALDIADSLCPNTIHVFTDPSGHSVISTPNVQADCSSYRLRDFRDDPDHVDRPYVRAWPHMRSYLAVPLRTSSGICIGTYCVVDSHPRDDFDESAVTVLNDIAHAIMDHIELVKMQEQHKRLERLVNSLCLYVEENTSMQAFEEGISSDDWQSADAPVMSPGSSDSSISDGLESGRSPEINPACTSDDSLQTKLTTPSPNPRLDPFDDLENDQTDRKSPRLHPATPSRRLPPESRTGTISDAFSRAASLIQEATDMAGIVFLDASPTGFSTRLNFPKSADSPMEFPITQTIKSVKMCEVLGTSATSEMDPTTGGTNVPEPFLQRLLQVHPQGNIFFVDEVDESEKDDAGAVHLFQIFSPARSILFLPLWDYHKEGWHAAAIGWSNTSNRVFTSEDLVYMSAFSNSVMNEVSRVEAMSVSHAKSNFISSISHELRSPLHGILASTELIKRTGLDEERLALAEMIEVCGITLLETMDHLLDFAKINHLTRQCRRRSSGSPTGSRGGSRHRSEHLGLSKTADLSALVQEVVEGAHLGHCAQTTSQLERAGIRLNGRKPTKSKHSKCPEEEPTPVLLTMDIEKHENWRIHTEPGAWRRIVLNIVGNALKYTGQGSIEVSLRQVDAVKQQPSLTEDDAAPAERQVCFSVKDSGRGISPDYLKYRLFTPYAQEDTLVSGTGLGLSIVHHLVTHLGGKVDIKSEVGVGTHVQVTIPIPAGAEHVTPKIKSERNPIGKIGQLLRGKTIMALFSMRSPEESEAQKLISSAINTAEAWYGLEAVPESSANGSHSADFYLLHASQLQQEHAEKLRNVEGPIIVLCTAPPSPGQIEAAALCNATFLQQPFGPKKLKTALKAALRRYRNPTSGQPIISPLDLTSPPTTSHIELPYREGATAIFLPAPTGFNLAPPPKLTKFDSSNIRTPSSPSPSPANQAAQAIDRPSSPPPSKASRQRLHLLLVDDNPINLRILTTYAKKLDCTWATATNGRDAVEEFKKAGKDFDYVLMDVSMPIMNGFEATREIRAWERICGEGEGEGEGQRYTKILALTGLGSAESQQEAFTSGMDEFLIKPVPLGRLERVLFGESPRGKGKG